VYEQRSALLKLILLRYVLACFVVALTWAFLGEQVPPNLLAPFLLVVSALTAIFLVLWRYAKGGRWQYEIQFYSDLAILTVLIFWSGGVDSVFTPFYVLIIVHSSVIKGRKGVITGLTLSVLSFLLIIHLGYLGWIPRSSGLQDYQNIIQRLSVNLLAFFAVAFLGISLSERLQKARSELGHARVIQENIVESIRSGLLTLDLEGRISFANRVGAGILDYEKKDLVGQQLSQVFPRDVFQRLQGHDYGETSRALRLEQPVRTQLGRQIYLGLGCSPLLSQDLDQERLGYILSFQDLTEIKKREEEIQFREKMAAIGEMAAGLAHELRNPLGSLSGSIQILQSELHLSQNQERLLDIVLRESERLNRTVGGFLAYAGPQPSAKQSVELDALVRETAELFRNNPEFAAENHSISFEPGDTTARAFCNPDQIRQVIWNLMQNGIRAMPEGGALSVELEQLEGRTVLQVEDQGVGMDEETKEKLYQPFHSRFRRGAGLGMALVYQIVQQHSGRIEIQTEVGKGTRISISLPQG